MDEEENNLLAKASRNVMILNWLRDLEKSRDTMGMFWCARTALRYAKWAGMPAAEITLDYITDPASLDWFWAAHEVDIRAHAALKQE